MYMSIMTKARTFRGTAIPAKETEYAINFNDDKSITVYRDRIAGTTFKVGDTASYDSFNLVYTGTITKITDKAITIAAYKGTHNEEIHRLNLHVFSWRNYSFNAEKTAKYNSEEMQYL